MIVVRQSLSSSIAASFLVFSSSISVVIYSFLGFYSAGGLRTGRRVGFLTALALDILSVLSNVYGGHPLGRD